MTEGFFPVLNFRGILPLCVAGFMALAASALGQGAKPAPQVTIAKPFTYETVSVHPCKSGSEMSVQRAPSRFSARCTTLWGLIFNAFDLRPNDPIPGLPGWDNSARFDVEAKMDEGTFAALERLQRDEQGEQRQRMLQSILADRFRLRFHHETKVRPIYALVIAKSGFKLKELPAGAEDSGWSGGRGKIEIHGESITKLAFNLSDLLGRAVVDQTNLAGRYDIVLKWTPDEQRESADAGPSIFTAIEEQLGLKLESTKGPVDTIVIDHVEKPSEN